MKKKRLPLTEEEAKVFKILKRYFIINEYMPTYDEIADAMGYKTNGRQRVAARINNMAKKGAILKGRGWRNIQLLDYN